MCLSSSDWTRSITSNFHHSLPSKALQLGCVRWFYTSNSHTSTYPDTVYCTLSRLPTRKRKLVPSFFRLSASLMFTTFHEYALEESHFHNATKHTLSQILGGWVCNHRHEIFFHLFNILYIISVNHIYVVWLIGVPQIELEGLSAVGHCHAFLINTMWKKESKSTRCRNRLGRCWLSSSSSPHIYRFVLRNLWENACHRVACHLQYFPWRGHWLLCSVM